MRGKVDENMPAEAATMLREARGSATLSSTRHSLAPRTRASLTAAESKAVSCSLSISIRGHSRLSSERAGRYRRVASGQTESCGSTRPIAFGDSGCSRPNGPKTGCGS